MTRQLWRLAAILAAAAALASFPAWGQERPAPPPRPVIDLAGTVRWDQGEISASATLALASAGIAFPGGRARAEDLLDEAFPRLLRPALLALQADSASTVADVAARGEIDLATLDAVSEAGRRVAPSLSTDLTTLTGRRVVGLYGVAAALTLHRQPASPPRPLLPRRAGDYTGIVVIADGTLPVHGREVTAAALPCLFPRIWDTDMNLIYERNMVDPAALLTGERGVVTYAPRDAVFRNTPTGLDDGLLEAVGDNPLRVLAREVFGVCPTDPVIDRDDALIILSSEANRRLLAEGRVAIILGSQTLRGPLGG